MNWIALLTGLLVLAVTASDFIYTTISAHGVGPLTRLTARTAFRSWNALTPGKPGELTQLLTGPLCMCAIAGTWMIGTVLGWYLVFQFQNEALLVEGRDATWVQALSFIGNSISTAGSSNVNAGGPWWDVMGAVAAVSGMIVLTLSVSFVLNVMTTVASGRAFATLVHSADAGDRANVQLFLPPLSLLTSSLKAAPVALCYTAGQPDQRMTDALAHFVRDIDHDESVLRHYRPALSGLPHADVRLDDDYATVLRKLQDWAQTYKIADDAGAAQSDDPAAEGSGGPGKRGSDAEPERGEAEEREEADHVGDRRHEHA